MRPLVVGQAAASTLLAALQGLLPALCQPLLVASYWSGVSTARTCASAWVWLARPAHSPAPARGLRLLAGGSQALVLAQQNLLHLILLVGREP